MMTLPPFIETYFFRPVSARGFGLMRMAWAGATLLFLLMQWPDIGYYYADSGILPPELQETVLRGQLRFSVLDWVSSDGGVFALYLLMLGAFTCALLGLFPRITVIVSCLLLFSFHERMIGILGGGDTVLRLIGFLLMICPNLDAFSLKRLRMQRRAWKKTGTLLSEPMMPIWPWRLLLWQMIVLYVASFHFKLLGELWMDGTAVGAVLQHPWYGRWHLTSIDWLLPLAPVITYLTLVFEGAWLLLLIPQRLVKRIMPMRVQKYSLLRVLLLCGIVFHGSIFILMDVGSFSPAMLAGYVGLLRGEDVDRLREILNKKFDRKKKIDVLYDGHCGLCRRSVFWLSLLDWLKRLQLIDFRDAGARKKAAPDLSLEDLDRALHIKRQNDTYLQGFFAFRHLTWHLPLLWPLAPLLYVPGVPLVGQWIYAKIATRRKKCSHGECLI